MLNKFLYIFNSLAIDGLYFDITISNRKYIRIRFW